MLECKGGYEKFELADFVFLASLHDIGAYKTENLKDMVRYEYRETLAHSTYGYLFFKYLSPLSELAAILLYHHTDYAQLRKIDCQYADVAADLNLAEKLDLLLFALGDKFDFGLLEKQAGTVISSEALALFREADRNNRILEKVRDGSYKQELDEIVHYMIFNNEDKKKSLQMLMFCQGFRSEFSVVDTVTCMCIAENIGQRMRLGSIEMEQLYYGALLHDIGMLSIPREIIEKPGQLTPEEYTKIKMHVHIAEKALNDRMASEVVALVATHHERCDGSGYPRGLRDTQMNHNQKILQLADTVTALHGKRPHRAPLKESEVPVLLRKDTAAGKYSLSVVNVFLNDYEEIMRQVGVRADETMATYRKLNLQYKQVSERLKNSRI